MAKQLISYFNSNMLKKYLLMIFLLQISCKEKFDYNGSEGKTLSLVNSIKNSIAAHIYTYQNSKLTNEELLQRVLVDCRQDFNDARNFKFNIDNLPLDMWGSPLRILIINGEISNEKPVVKVWSFGKNKIDDNGINDDIMAGKHYE
jgi:hypothetical protein